MVLDSQACQRDGERGKSPQKRFSGLEFRV